MSGTRATCDAASTVHPRRVVQQPEHCASDSQLGVNHDQARLFSALKRAGKEKNSHSCRRPRLAQQEHHPGWFALQLGPSTFAS